MSAAKNAAHLTAKPPLAADDHRHGTENGYTNLRCRCERCRRAHAIYRIAYMESRRVALGPCSIHGCTRGQYAKGYCQSHYERQRVHGDVAADTPLRESSVGDRDLRCATCREWLPDSAFSHSAANPHRRGRHQHCTACLSQYRREYREARKVPCSHGCGTLVLHERRDPSKPPECLPCVHKRLRKSAA